MKKLILCSMLALAVMVSPAFAINYLATPASITINGLGNTATVTVALQALPAGIITAGFWFDGYNATIADVDTAPGSVQVFDGVNGPAGPWDPGLSAPVDDPSGPASLFVAMGNLATVPSGNQNLGIVTLKGLALGTTTITIKTIPGFDTVVGDSTVYDPQIPSITLPVTVAVPPCTCSVAPDGLTIKADPNVNKTQPYTATAGPDCTNPPSYVWSDTCTNASVDQTGLLTIPPRTTGDAETCTVCVTDTANTDNQTQQNVTCCATVTLERGSTCETQIALGRQCPGEAIDDPAFNRPGRRGLAATCNDIIDFTVCSNCQNFDPACLVWSVSPAAPFLSFTQIDECCWRLNIGDSCSQLDKVETYEITVTDTCANSTDSVFIEIGKVIVDIGDTTVQPSTETATVDINLINPEHYVRALSLDIKECQGGADKLTCTGCMIDPHRALTFTCLVNELPDGSCRVVMFTTHPSAMVLWGRGTVAQVIYQKAEPEGIPSDCVCLRPVNINVSDSFNENLCACQSTGEVCFRTCGDIYPQDCIGGTCGALTTCGNGVVDLFDILEAIDIILGLQTATECQIENGDVPNGMPPYCGDPPGTPNCESDGDIDIFDLLVMIDQALGRMNCCDYCVFGQIY